jgi:hypothetical protein
MDFGIALVPAMMVEPARLGRQGAGRQWVVRVTHRAGSGDPATSLIRFGNAMMPNLCPDVTAGHGLAGSCERSGASMLRREANKKKPERWQQPAVLAFFDCYLVPRAGLEPAHLSAADFESAASTDSAIGANRARIIPESSARFKRIPAATAGRGSCATARRRPKWRCWQCRPTADGRDVRRRHGRGGARDSHAWADRRR